jgi:hypothetical protein
MRAVLRAATDADARVLAMGEAHAPKGATAPSAAKRFTETLLPLLAGEASDLLVEAMMPPVGCADATAAAKKKQAPATSQQAPTNQNEYLAMGERARTLGIVPDMLRPSCADLASIEDAGEKAIATSLTMIARLTTKQAARLVARDARSEADRAKVVVVYGGMLHNDLDPVGERAAWSYAAPLDRDTDGKVVAVDLVVPEFIRADETWQGMPWVAEYAKGGAQLAGKTTVFRVGARSFVIVFAEQDPGTPSARP